MLSAAHVLAMDAKNLLDVVDSVRVRYPNVFVSTESKSDNEAARKYILTTACTAAFYVYALIRMFLISNNQAIASDPVYAVASQKSARTKPFESTILGPAPMNTVTEEIDDGQQQTYQNLAQLNEQLIAAGASTSNDDIFASQHQVFHQSQTEGIYDNDCIITAQMKTVAAPVAEASNPKVVSQQYDPTAYDASSIDQCASTAAPRNNLAQTSQPPNKPPIAHKPSALQAKIQALNNAGLSVQTVDKYIPPMAATLQPTANEPLQIVENDQELYCNTKMLSQKWIWKKKKAE